MWFGFRMIKTEPLDIRDKVKTLCTSGFLVSVTCTNTYAPRIFIMFSLNNLKYTYHSLVPKRWKLSSGSCNYYWASITSTNWSEFASGTPDGNYLHNNVLWQMVRSYLSKPQMKKKYSNPFYILLIEQREFNMHKIPEDKHPISPHLTLSVILHKISLKPKPNKMHKILIY